MLNDVHIPPDDSNIRSQQAKPSAGHLRSERETHATANRVRERLPTAERADIGEAIYGEPEDRGDSFNTLFSASVVAIVVLLAVVLTRG